MQLVAAVVVLFLLPFSHALSPGATCDNISNRARIDCHPEALGTDQDQVRDRCFSRGCCWREPTGDTFPGVDISTPWCYYPSDYKNYEVREYYSSNDITTIQLQKVGNSGFPRDSQRLVVTVSAIHDDVVRVKITDPMVSRFEVPEPELNVHPTHTDQKKYRVCFDRETRVLEIIRRSSQKPLFSVNLQKVIFSDQFLQLTNENLSSNYLHGFGENMDSFTKSFHKFKRVVALNSDQAPTPHLPLYGTHPFYLMKENEKESHGVLFFNNHIQEVVFNPSRALTYRTIGGILDYFIFLGPSNNDVMRQKQDLVGHSPLPPFWSLGFHLCRWGYRDTAHLEAVYNRTIEAGIPLDVKWVDIDYMKNRNDFTVDDVNFKGLNDLAKKIQSDGRRFIPIIDPAVSASEPRGQYPPYDEGIEMDIFVRNKDGSHFIGKVWNPDTSIFPDFTHPRAIEYWTRQMKRLNDQLTFDGMWIDMNEPANMMDGEKGKGCPTNNLNNPQYIPGQDKGLYLFKKTICPSAQHDLASHYDLHNMYAFYEAKATHAALKVLYPGKRPFIVSRATVTGQNIYSYHWTGDVFSTWEYLKNSIADVLTMNLFGFSMVGPDICGFNGDTNVELCARWQSVGAFFPFSRNHNSIDAREQDPVALGQVVVDATKNALRIRYTLLPYLYTLFYENSLTGHPVIRSLSWDHPWDDYADNIETQFLWGTGLMIIPALEEHIGKGKSFRGYFPKQVKWYDYETLTKVKVEDEADRESYYELPLDKIVVAVRGENILPYHTKTGLSTSDQKDSPFGLIIALSSAGTATGKLYWDDGETENTQVLGKYSLLSFEAKNATLASKLDHKGFTLKELKEVKVLGVWNVQVKNVTVNGNSHSSFNYDKNKELLIISDLNVNLNELFEIKWN